MCFPGRQSILDAAQLEIYGPKIYGPKIYGPKPCGLDHKDIFKNFVSNRSLKIGRFHTKFWLSGFFWKIGKSGKWRLRLCRRQ